MAMQVNYEKPQIMHIDLNSCFATIEQQANPLIRNKPVAVAAYDSPGGMVIAASYDAKAMGIKLGVNVRQARQIYPKVIILMPDPDKYFDAHARFKKVLLKYTSDVTPKSVDEFVVDFSGSPALRAGQTMRQIGLQIKQDIKASLGEYVTVNVGIGPNLFLAKLAAGLNKPDGLDVVDGNNLRQVYGGLKLTDLPGISSRYKIRLNLAGIYTPLQFLDASLPLIKKQVFKSIVGYYWYMRLRGHEIDAYESKRASFGNQYALGQKTADKQEILKLLMKLCEKTGRRLRANGYTAGGVHLWLTLQNRSYWARSKKTKAIIYSTQDIYGQAQKLLDQALVDLNSVVKLGPQLDHDYMATTTVKDGVPSEFPFKVTNISVTVFNLSPAQPVQAGLFDDTRLDSRSLAIAADEVNDKFGEFTLTPAVMANMQDVILKRVAFGGIGG